MSSEYFYSIDYEFFEDYIGLKVHLHYKVNLNNKIKIRELAKAIPEYEKTSSKCIDKFSNSIYIATVDISIWSQYECTLNYFYNYVSQYRDSFSEDFVLKTKGVAAMLMKKGLEHAIKNKYLKSRAEMNFFASGRKMNKSSMQGLVDYYKSLGFRLVDKKACIKNWYCEMTGPIEKMIKKRIKLHPVIERVFS